MYLMLGLAPFLFTAFLLDHIIAICSKSMSEFTLAKKIFLGIDL